jgi:hypothetical protein
MADLFGLHRLLVNCGVMIQYDGECIPFVPPHDFERVVLTLSLDSYEMLADHISDANQIRYRLAQQEYESEMRDLYPALASAYENYQMILKLVE